LLLLLLLLLRGRGRNMMLGDVLLHMLRLMMLRVLLCMLLYMLRLLLRMLRDMLRSMLRDVLGSMLLRSVLLSMLIDMLGVLLCKLRRMLWGLRRSVGRRMTARSGTLSPRRSRCWGRGGGRLLGRWSLWLLGMVSHGLHRHWWSSMVLGVLDWGMLDMLRLVLVLLRRLLCLRSIRAEVDLLGRRRLRLLLLVATSHVGRLRSIVRLLRTMIPVRVSNVRVLRLLLQRLMVLQRRHRGRLRRWTP
jgi:hypothetical protein